MGASAMAGQTGGAGVEGMLKECIQVIQCKGCEVEYDIIVIYVGIWVLMFIAGSLLEKVKVGGVVFVHCRGS